MSLNKIFEKIYVINLKRRRDRRVLCSQKLEKMGIIFQYIDGVDGSDSRYDTLCSMILKKKDTWIKSRGAIGLLMTYKVIMEDALEKKYNNILILEDDINFHKQFEYLLQKTTKNINFNETDCVWLGANQYRYDDDQKKQLADPNCEFYTVSRTKWCYTFGTYAIAFNRKFMLELKKSLDLNKVTYAIDVHIFWTLAKANMSGRILRPFLILPDVSDSDNMGERDQKEFMLERMYCLDDYKYISIADVNALKNILNERKISLRQLFSDHSTGSLLLNRSSFTDIFKNIKNIEQKELDLIVKYTQTIFNYYEINDNILLTDLFRSIEERKSFIFVVPSFNNIENYKINLDSVRHQLYPKYQFRVIYVNDCSDDGTDVAVKEYITQHKLENFVTYMDMEKCQNKRQRQGMGRYIAYHKCFDDEICLNLDGDDWLYDEFVLDNMDKHFVNNNLLASYGSYYVYDETDVGSGQHMKIPYNNKLLNLRQFPGNVKASRSFKNYDWICGHLRAGYAKLFKSIELRHFVGPDGYFFRMASDQNETYPVLEMAGDRHLNILKPTMVYNKYNSKQFETSYYRMNEAKNKDAKRYRDEVTQLIKTRPMYPKFGSGELKAESKLIDFDFIDPTVSSDEVLISLRSKKSTYVYVDSEKNHSDIKTLPSGIVSLSTSKPGVIFIDSTRSKDHDGAIIKVDEKTRYAVKKIKDVMMEKDIIGLIQSNKGFYNREKLIQLIEKKSIINDEIVLIPLN